MCDSCRFFEVILVPTYIKLFKIKFFKLIMRVFIFYHDNNPIICNVYPHLWFIRLNFHLLLNVLFKGEKCRKQPFWPLNYAAAFVTVDSVRAESDIMQFPKPVLSTVIRIYHFTIFNLKWIYILCQPAQISVRKYF